MNLQFSRNVVVVLALAPLFLFAACSKTSSNAGAANIDAGPAAPLPPKVTESCDQAALLGMCMDYTRTDIMMHKTLCEGFKGKFAEAPCSNDRLVGSCALEDGDIKRYYEKLNAKDVGYTLEKAKENGEGEVLKGKFTQKR
jgi:hypothetical protein